MNINIEECDDKLLVKVSLVPYDVGRRNPQVIRETCDYNKINNVLLTKGYIGYIPDINNLNYKIDNKFTSLHGVFVFSRRKTIKVTKEEKPSIVEQKLEEKEANILDNQEDTVLEYPKKKRRRRRKSYNTDE